MVYQYVSFSIAVVFISFIVGMLVTAALKKTSFYDTTLSNLNFIRSDNVNKWVGVNMVKWIVKNTPFKFLNQKLQLAGKSAGTDLQEVRKAMTSAETDHLAGFLFVTVFVFTKLYQQEWLFALTIMIANILMNLHPSLLQQQNKRRIDKIVKKRR
ncbi:hypothetical protein I5907_14120 [Panacibacter sp. DH6]|uniref:Glycosyl-4,4'-diaponeurosporenoate acyltransferase n=1 Tax=Panacibacter microcysteis TaxID=2793269 RepID=A0A931E8R4_9BACT|nr:hypothetical protein [Panacibacter microcysteis]MBG9377375.1 hypothetical protein [Panacibacter microcysteis]